MPPLATAFIRTVIQKPADRDFKQVEDSVGESGSKSGKSFSSKFASEAQKGVKDAGPKLGGLFAALVGGSGLLAAAGPLAALGAGVAGFAALAAPALSKVEQALGKTGKAGQQAWAQLTPDQRLIGSSIKNVQGEFDKVAAAATPLIASVVSNGSRLVGGLLKNIGPLARAGGSILDSLIGPLTKIANSKAFAGFVGALASFGEQAGRVFGPALARLLPIVMTLVEKLLPPGLKILQQLVPALVSVVGQLAPLIVDFADIAAVVVTWLDKNKLLIPAIYAGAAAFLALKLSILGNPIFLIGAAIAVLALIVVKYHKQIWDFITRIWGDVFGFLKSVWDKITGAASAAWGAISAVTSRVWGVIAGVVRTEITIVRDVISVILDAISGNWSGVWHGLSKLVSDVLTGLRGIIHNIFGDAGTWLLSAGKDIIGGLLNGIRSVISGVGSFIKNDVVDPIVNAVKSFFGIHSPSTVFAEIGGHLISGLLQGIVKGNPVQLITHIFGSMPNALGALVSKGFVDLARLPLSALHALSGALGSVWHFITGGGGLGGSGVNRFTATAASVLRMLGQPLSDLSTVMTQMNTESGGNPFAVNRSDINWQEGHPSVGLMQVIAGTFDAYAGPFRNVGPFAYGVSENPLANIFAGLNYAVHRYGAGWTSVLGHGHGYAQGGPITEPIAGIGLRSGETYTFGERGDETVIPGAMRRGSSGGSVPVDTGLEDLLVAMSGQLAALGGLISQSGSRAADAMRLAQHKAAYAVRS